MSTGNPTFPTPQNSPGGGNKDAGKQEIKRTIAEGLGILSERVKDAIGARRVTAIKHEGFTDGFGGSMDDDNWKPRSNYHMFTIDLENNGKVWGLKVRVQDPVNDAFRVHTGVDMAKIDEWVYSFDGKTSVEITDPQGEKQVMELGQERTLDSLEQYLRSIMTRIKQEEEEYTG